jgi:hypothetical protein
VSAGDKSWQQHALPTGRHLCTCNPNQPAHTPIKLCFILILLCLSSVHCMGVSIRTCSCMLLLSSGHTHLCICPPRQSPCTSVACTDSSSMPSKQSAPAHVLHACAMLHVHGHTHLSSQLLFMLCSCGACSYVPAIMCACMHVALTAVECTAAQE